MVNHSMKLAVGRSVATASDDLVSQLVQRKVRVTAGMDAAVLAYGQAQGKAGLAEAYRSIIGRGLRAYRLEAAAAA